MYFTRSKGSETEKQSVSSNESEDLHPILQGQKDLKRKSSRLFQRKVKTFTQPAFGKITKKAFKEKWSLSYWINPKPLYSNLVHAKHYHAVSVVLPSRKPGKYMKVIVLLISMICLWVIYVIFLMITR